MTVSLCRSVFYSTTAFHPRLTKLAARWMQGKVFVYYPPAEFGIVLHNCALWSHILPLLVSSLILLCQLQFCRSPHRSLGGQFAVFVPRVLAASFLDFFLFGTIASLSEFLCPHAFTFLCSILCKVLESIFALEFALLFLASEFDDGGWKQFEAFSIIKKRVREKTFCLSLSLSLLTRHFYLVIFGVSLSAVREIDAQDKCIKQLRPRLSSLSLTLALASLAASASAAMALCS